MGDVGAWTFLILLTLSTVISLILCLKLRADAKTYKDMYERADAAASNWKETMEKYEDKYWEMHEMRGKSLESIRKLAREISDLKLHQSLREANLLHKINAGEKCPLKRAPILLEYDAAER